MTEKRFKLQLCSNGTYYVYENGTLTDIDFDKFNKESADALIDEVNALYEENEQLKAQLYCNHDGGVCSICKHCYLEEQSLYYISKCKKGHEQCSKVDVKYCEDFEIKGDLE